MPLIAVGKPNDFELYEYESPEWFALSEKEREWAWFIDPEYNPLRDYYQPHRCEFCGGFLRNKPDREGPSTTDSSDWADYDCPNCGKTTSYEY